MGTSSYDHLPNLPAVAANVDALVRCFSDSELWGVDQRNISAVNNPRTHSDMLDPIHTAAEDAADTLLIYYSGHGLLDRRTNLQLALSGSIPGRFHTATLYDWIRDAIIDSPARRRIVILDCCYSGRALGTMSGSEVADEAEAEGTFLLAASAENKRALAPPGEKYTAFTGELVKLLQQGDPQGPQLWDLNSLYRLTRAALRAKSRPQPQKRDRNTAGELPLARNRAWLTSPRWPEVEPPVLDWTPPPIAERTAPAANAQRPSPATPQRLYKYVAPEAVRSATFAKARLGKRGYNEEEVDEFLEFVATELRNPKTKLKATDVHNVAFGRPPTGKRGYNENEVDTFLDLVEKQLRAFE
ncbi:hypothetical protein ALI144C_18415 [Actinosynnema sp. ALI-1.44]|nr:hypothetical protein ALI144C_18415 [Actinosynnema sp. ALI-1.44]